MEWSEAIQKGGTHFSWITSLTLVMTGIFTTLKIMAQKWKLMNSPAEDYHMHSFTYSDGLHTIDEIVQMAPKFWLKKIIITDHSQATLDVQGLALKCWRSTLKHWKNYYNDLEVAFGVEGDLLDEEGSCCFEIHHQASDFCILSAHHSVFQGELQNITQAYSRAIEKYHDQIDLIGHPFLTKTCEFLEVEEFVACLNRYNIPLEIDTAYLRNNKTDLQKLRAALELLETGVYVNSDMHTFADWESRKLWFDLLEERGFL